MFYFCYDLTELDLSNFYTNKLQNIECMFKECHSLRKLNIKNFKCDNDCEMFRVFEGCDSLVEVICSEDMRNKLKINK